MMRARLSARTARETQIHRAPSRLLLFVLYHCSLRDFPFLLWGTWVSGHGGVGLGLVTFEVFFNQNDSMILFRDAVSGHSGDGLAAGHGDGGGLSQPE